MASEHKRCFGMAWSPRNGCHCDRCEAHRQKYELTPERFERLWRDIILAPKRTEPLPTRAMRAEDV